MIPLYTPLSYSVVLKFPIQQVVFQKFKLTSYNLMQVSLFEYGNLFGFIIITFELHFLRLSRKAKSSSRYWAFEIANSK